MENEEDGELRNPFPSPPSHYTKYTTHNLNLLALLKERSTNAHEDQREILRDQGDVPDWSLLQLEKPRVDWILSEEDASFDVFGDTWFIKEKVLSLKDHGLNQLYPSEPAADRRPALLSILRSLLVTYSKLTTSLLIPPPSMASDDPPEWVKNIDWLGTLGQNLMAATNDLRPVQARSNLEAMMQQQLSHRRNETAEIHRRCDEWEAKLAALRQATLDLPRISPPTNPAPNPESLTTNKLEGCLDVHQWVEES